MDDDTCRHGSRVFLLMGDFPPFPHNVTNFQPFWIADGDFLWISTARSLPTGRSWHSKRDCGDGWLGDKHVIPSALGSTLSHRVYADVFVVDIPCLHQRDSTRWVGVLGPLGKAGPVDERRDRNVCEHWIEFEVVSSRVQ